MPKEKIDKYVFESFSYKVMLYNIEIRNLLEQGLVIKADRVSQDLSLYIAEERKKYK